MRKTAELSEGQIAEIGEAMALTTRAESHLEKALGRLRHCKIEIDDDSLKHVSFYLDQIHQKLAEKVMAHVEATS